MQSGDDDLHPGGDGMGCPSGMELALLRAGDLHDLRTARLRQHVGQCLVCQERAAELAEAESEFLFSTQSPGLITAAHRVAHEAGRRRRSRRAVALALPLSLTAALGVICLVSARGLWRGSAADSAPDSAPRFGAQGSARLVASRSKGSFSAMLFRKRDASVTEVDERMTFQRGDRLRFAYSVPHDGYVAVFGLDEKGHLASYYPPSDLSSLAVHAGQQVLLPDAIELDADHSDERLYLVYRETPWKDELLRGAFTTSSAGASATVTLPGFAQVSWLVRRE